MLADLSNVTVENVIKELASMAFTNMSDYLKTDEDGEFIGFDITGLSRAQTAAIQEVTVNKRRTYSGSGEDRETTEYITTKFKLADKRGCLELLGKHLSAFPNRQELRVLDSEDDYTDAELAAIAQGRPISAAKAVRPKTTH